MSQGIDLSFCREEFPALNAEVNGRPVAFFDGPGGTQVPQQVIDAVTDYYIQYNANSHGLFRHSRETDAMIQSARQAMADFLGAPTARQIAFGANMTTLAYSLAHALGRDLKDDDEVLVTELDHDANISPWLMLEQYGARVRFIPVEPETCTLDQAAYKELLNDRTRVVAIGYASNAVGTVNPVEEMVALANERGATTIVDAVHYAPHGSIDVARIGCDFLLCSPYKFFGPHLGVLYGKEAAFEALKTDRVRPQVPTMPEKIETGTLNHEGIAGTLAAVDFLADLGLRFEHLAPAGVAGRRRYLLAALAAIEAYEAPLLRRLKEDLAAIPGVRLYGPPEGTPRTPTLAFTLAGRSPQEVAEKLGDQGIYVWDGDFYAVTIIERLGLAESGGVVRIGLAPYNTAEEIQWLVDAVAALAR